MPKVVRDGNEVEIRITTYIEFVGDKERVVRFSETHAEHLKSVLDAFLAEGTPRQVHQVGTEELVTKQGGHDARPAVMVMVRRDGRAVGSLWLEQDDARSVRAALTT